ncbi:MAG TPA: hypothetical protein VMF67_15930 [Rhizomicrobium sp.]|nr:hypothetical protein [Rhizomicrobium sp.]
MSHPVIAIAGRVWPMPLLAPRQNRIVLPGVVALAQARAGHYNTLCDVVFAALTRAHPGLDRREFDDWPIATYELLDALPVIAQQTGFLERNKNVIPAKAEIRLPDWDAIIAQFVNFLPGTTPDYWEDALTAPRLDAMLEEWRKHPPLAVLAAHWLGYKPKPRDAEAIEELMRLFPTGKIACAPTMH